MNVHKGDLAIYRPARGAPVRVEVMGHSPKRVVICMHVGSEYLFRHVKADRLEKVPGGGLVECR